MHTEKKMTVPPVDITLEMLRAGMEAYREWDPGAEDEMVMLANAFAAMSHARRAPRQASSDLMADSRA